MGEEERQRRIGIDWGRIPPRPCASRRVDALNYPTNPPNLPKPQTSPQGGGFTLPLPPPRRHFPAGRSFSENAFSYLDPSKSNGKTNEKPTFSILGPFKPPHIPITLVIEALSASFFTFQQLFSRFP